MLDDLVELAAAKINLSLHVGPPKQNGRHDLISLVTFTDAQAADRLQARPDDAFSLQVTGPFSDAAGRPEDNLVTKAAVALSQALRAPLPKLQLTLTKNLPCAAGIGGGSADAAATLRLLSRWYDKTLNRTDSWYIAETLAPALGGDVLACFYSRTGLMSGEGERFRAIDTAPYFPAVLVNPGVTCPTGTIFQHFDADQPAALDHPPAPSDSAWALWLEYLSMHTHNALYPPAIAYQPVIATVLEQLETTPGARLARMSGSGATCFAIFETVEAANMAATDIAARYPEFWVKQTSFGDRRSVTRR
ncbi:MAG: 4-(cytidine 5'-diphospho)-2-C-methyl-D-erythritol kinase [Henriciella sp.]